jgi:hypothetical protein
VVSDAAALRLILRDVLRKELRLNIGKDKGGRVIIRIMFGSEEITRGYLGSRKEDK